jgi:hypothetical protein
MRTQLDHAHTTSAWSTTNTHFPLKFSTYDVTKINPSSTKTLIRQWTPQKLIAHNKIIKMSHYAQNANHQQTQHALSDHLQTTPQAPNGPTRD